MNSTTAFVDTHDDIIHICQRIFRSLMMAMASPGTIHQLPPISLAGIRQSYSFVLQPLLALLDLETSHCLFASDATLKKELESYLAANTQSSVASVETADFILCLDSSARSIFKAIKLGTLSSPDQGATVIYHVEKISSKRIGPTAENMILTGPGIEKQTYLSATGLSAGESELWQESRKDYPLGIDIFLVSATGEIAGIPRSTTLSKSGVN